MEKEIIVLDTSDEAAKKVTVTGWLSRDGIFWGNDERAARYSGCTHKRCECGNLMERHWLICETCRHKNARKKYMSLPFREWSGEPVCTRDGSNYFFDEDSLAEYCFENDLTEIELLFCEENKWRPVCGDYWSDDMPSDSDGELPQELQDALDNLNNVIKNLPAQSYSPGKIRTTYRIKPENF